MHNSGVSRRWKLIIARRAKIALDSLAEKDRPRIVEGLDILQKSPFSGDIVLLKGAGPKVWRRRVGDYRIFFEVSGEQISVTDIARRSAMRYAFGNKGASKR